MSGTAVPPLARRLLAELPRPRRSSPCPSSALASPPRTLSPGDIGLELFENAAGRRAAGLFTIILMFGRVSGDTSTRSSRWSTQRFRGLSLARRARLVPAQVTAASSARSRPTRCSRWRRSASRPTTAPDPRTCSPRSSPPDLLLPSSPSLGPKRSTHPRGRWRLHRRRVLLHQLRELRQPGDQRRPDVLRDVCRHRTGLGPRLRRRAAPRWRCRLLMLDALPRPGRPDEAAEVLLPHSDPARARPLP